MTHFFYNIVFAPLLTLMTPLIFRKHFKFTFLFQKSLHINVKKHLLGYTFIHIVNKVSQYKIIQEAGRHKLHICCRLCCHLFSYFFGVTFPKLPSFLVLTVMMKFCLASCLS